MHLFQIFFISSFFSCGSTREFEQDTDKGYIVGHTFDKLGQYGFISLDGGLTCQKFSCPQVTGSTSAFGINNNDIIVGTYGDSNVTFGYKKEYDSNECSALGSYGEGNVTAYAINDSDTIVGVLRNESGVKQAILSEYK